MHIEESHSIYQQLDAVAVDDIEYCDGPTLARALRCPRCELANHLAGLGVLADSAHQKLHELWATMRTINPAPKDTTLSFDNIYELIVWVYVQTPQFEVPPNYATSSKLVFRGHGDSIWKLDTTADRLPLMKLGWITRRRLISSSGPFRQNFLSN
ncbi:MAG: hypothetical protein ACR2JB_03910 [Bryobacteraceae bacterium]